jgi:hypothetical protein
MASPPTGRPVRGARGGRPDTNQTIERTLDALAGVLPPFPAGELLTAR